MTDMGEVALRLEAEFHAMVDLAGVDPEAAEMAARNIIAMPNETNIQRDHQLVAWVNIMRQLRALSLTP